MSEVASRPAASRGRGSGRGGRVGFAGRGGRRTNGDKSDPKSATEGVSNAFDDDDSVAELRKQYGDKTSVIREMFPDWSEVDVLFALHETNGDENDAVTRIAEGTISQWGEVSKTKKVVKPKAKEASAAMASNEATTAGSRPSRGARAGPEAGRGRGRASDRGGRGGRGRSSQPATNGNRNKENQQLSVPTEDSSAWSTEEAKVNTPETKDVAPEPPALSTAPKSAAPAAGKTWASMLRQSTAPKPAPKPKEPAASKPVETSEPSVPISAPAEPDTPQAEEENTPIAAHAEPEPAVAIVEPEIALTPSKDELTKLNLDQVVDESQPPGTATAASTAADSWDPRHNAASASATPLSAAQQKHQAQRQGSSGYAATAGKATAPRAPVFQRRVLDQEESVRMPGTRELDRAAVQFGAFSLTDGDEDIDGDREEAETRGQPPADSPVAQPRATLPPLVQPAAVPESLPQKSAAVGAPPTGPSSATHLAQTTGSSQASQAAGQQQYGRFGQITPQDAGGGPQKPVDPFSQQSTQSTQPSFENYPTQTSQPPSQQATGAFASGPNDYSSYYSANQQERNQYNYYGQQYGQQQQQGAHSQHDGAPSQPRGFGGYNASQTDSLSQYPQSGSMHNQPRLGGAGNETQNSGHSTPNPATQTAQQSQQPQQGQQQPSAGTPGSQPQSQGNQYYGHPYYSNPYYHQYYSGYGQGGFGPYGKSGMYGQPYGVSPNGPYDQGSSPGSFGQSSGHRDGGAAAGLSDYGRGGSAQAGSQQGLGGNSFGSVHDSFARGASSFQSQGQQFNTQGQPGGSSSADDLKPFGDGKPTSGPSPSMGGARPGSATNNAPTGQSGLPPTQGSQMASAYGGYPSHQQGHGAQSGSGYGMGGGAGGSQHGSTPYGSYGQGFGSGGYYSGQQQQHQQQQQQRGGWGGNYH